MAGSYTVAKLNIHLGVVADALAQGFQNAIADVRKFEQSALNASSAMNQSGGGGGLLAGLQGLKGHPAVATIQAISQGLQTATHHAASFVSWLHQISTEVDNITDVADRVGATTEEIAALYYAADQADVGVEFLDKALAKLNKVLGEAVTGNEEAADSFAQLGLDAGELEKLPLGEAFSKIADAIKALPTPARQTAAAMAIFGKGAADLLPMLNAGSEGLKEWAERAKELGLTFGRVPAEKIAIAEAAWKDMVAAWKAFGVIIAPEVASWLEGLAKTMTEIAKAGQWAVRSLAELAKHTGANLDGFSNIDARAAASAAKAMDDRRRRAEAESLAEELEEQKRQKDASQHMPELGKAAMSGLREALEEFEKFRKKADDVSKAMRTPFEVFKDTIIELKSYVDAGAISWETYGRATKKAGDDLKKAQDAADKTKDLGKTSEGVGAAVRGTKEAVSAIAQSDRTIQRMLEAQAKQLEETKRTTTAIKDVEKAIKEKKSFEVREVSVL